MTADFDRKFASRMAVAQAGNSRAGKAAANNMAQKYGISRGKLARTLSTIPNFVARVRKNLRVSQEIGHKSQNWPRGFGKPFGKKCEFFGKFTVSKGPMFSRRASASIQTMLLLGIKSLFGQSANPRWSALDLARITMGARFFRGVVEVCPPICTLMGSAAWPFQTVRAGGPTKLIHAVPVRAASAEAASARAALSFFLSSKN